MRITLESFRLLNPKVAQFERSTGGTPEITFQEVADVLGRCTSLCSMYSRYHYGLDDTYRTKLVDVITDQMFRQDRKRKRPLLLHRYHWQQVTKLTLEAYRGGIYLTRQQKKIAADVTRWTKRHEEAHRKVRELLDNWDYELRSVLGEWNRTQQEDGYR
jgi:hypothetical protein